MLFNWSCVNALVIAPHTDDAEIGCGGLISKILRAGGKVRVIALSDASISVECPNGIAITRVEMKRAMDCLGVIDFKIYNFETRTFDRQRQEILDVLIQEKSNFMPNFVICPSSEDIHQDHYVTRMESERAFKSSVILGYSLPWNCKSIQNVFSVKIDNLDLRKKISAVSEYSSQQKRIYTSAQYIEAQAVVSAVRAGAVLAEAFEVISCNLD